MFFKINKCIFIGVRMKAFTMQSKNKIGEWTHMRPPPPLIASITGPCILTFLTCISAYIVFFSDDG